MALLRDISKYGVTFSNTYNRVSACNYVNALKKVITQNELDTTDPANPVPVPPTVSWEKTRKVEFTVLTYLSQEAFENQEEVVDQKLYGFYVPVTETSVDVLDMCYAHLKTLPEFANAVDA
jgi:hypothetical protein